MQLAYLLRFDRFCQRVSPIMPAICWIRRTHNYKYGIW